MQASIFEAYISSAIGNNHRRAASFSFFGLSVASGKDRKMYFDQKEFGKRIQDLRKRAGMTQEQLSEKLSFDRPHLAKIETGIRSCSIETLLEFSELFGVSTDYLLKGNEDMTAEKEQLLQIAKQLKEISQKI